MCVLNEREHHHQAHTHFSSQQIQMSCFDFLFLSFYYQLLRLRLESRDFDRFEQKHIHLNIIIIMRNGYDGAGAGVRVFIQLIKSTSSFARARSDETLTKSIIYYNFQMYKIRLKRNEPQEAHTFFLAYETRIPTHIHILPTIHKFIVIYFSGSIQSTFFAHSVWRK